MRKEKEYIWIQRDLVNEEEPSQHADEKNVQKALENCVDVPTLSQPDSWNAKIMHGKETEASMKCVHNSPGEILTSQSWEETTPF